MGAAAAILIQGAVHLQQYFERFSAVPVIGPLFLANAAASLVIAIWLVKRGSSASVVAGAALLAGSLAAIFLTRTTGLFGYVSSGYGAGEIVAIVFEVVGLILLGLTGSRRLRPA